MKITIKDLDTDKCVGCFACMAACPKACITVKEDEEGFLVPFLNEEECIKCGNCLNVCQIEKIKAGEEPAECYAIQNKNIDELKESSSGGFAYMISKKAIDDGGVVYGCVLDEDFNVKHIRITDHEGLKKASKSKYVQSYFGDVYKQLEKDCKQKKNVVVIATPCQIAAIRNFIKKDYDNLLLIDLICHGVPNNRLFKDYVSFEKKKIGNFIDYEFRNKEKYS